MIFVLLFYGLQLLCSLNLLKTYNWLSINCCPPPRHRLATVPRAFISLDVSRIRAKLFGQIKITCNRYMTLWSKSVYQCTPPLPRWLRGVTRFCVYETFDFEQPCFVCISNAWRKSTKFVCSSLGYFALLIPTSTLSSLVSVFESYTDIISWASSCPCSDPLH